MLSQFNIDPKIKLKSPLNETDYKLPPLASLGLGIGLLAVIWLVVGLLGGLVMKALGQDLFEWVQKTGASPLWLKFWVGGSNFLIWGVPALIWGHFALKEGAATGLRQKPQALNIMLAGAVWFVSLILLLGVMLDPSSWEIPEAMQGFWQKLIEREKSVLGAMQVILDEQKVPGLLLNLLVLSLGPAIAEELFFRRFLQNAFHRRMPVHLAVLLTAFIFSAIHLQPAGFFSRFLLGIILGYLYHYSRNIWISIFVHALHNGWIVLASWMIVRSLGKLPTLASGGRPDLPWTVMAGSFVLGLVTLLGFIFLQKRKEAED